MAIKYEKREEPQKRHPQPNPEGARQVKNSVLGHELATAWSRNNKHKAMKKTCG